ncbi:HAD hydrolase-like protein [Pseudomonas urmiensis]|uniref:HAD hydrolase-like protein n=1 Tax=Pseudomonas urmiensis TaxID=2745493 RepID=A0ABW8NQJ9_9PSED|nr:HAD hydrolase-like protein [Pseudomonas sp. URMO17WK12:I11]
MAAPYGSVTKTLLFDLDAYLFSHELGGTKPNPIIYDAALQALDVSRTPHDVFPHGVAMIGDSTRCDRNGLRAFAIQSLHLDRTSTGGLQNQLYRAQLMTRSEVQTRSWIA